MHNGNDERERVAKCEAAPRRTSIKDCVLDAGIMCCRGILRNGSGGHGGSADAARLDAALEARLVNGESVSQGGSASSLVRTTGEASW